MLSESDRVLSDAERCEELVRPRNKVAYSLVANDAVSHGISNPHHHWLSLVSILGAGTPQGELCICHSHKLRVRFVLRVNEVLNLGHGELTNTQKTLARRDFISEAEANLCSGKRCPTIVKFDQSTEVDEDALGGLWAQIALE